MPKRASRLDAELARVPEAEADAPLLQHPERHGDDAAVGLERLAVPQVHALAEARVAGRRERGDEGVEQREMARVEGPRLHRQRDLAGHMAMISPQVTVFGVPGFETLGYQDWYRQCEHEFPQGLIAAIAYSRIDIRVADEARILFKALETTRTADGAQTAQGVEMQLQRQGDAWLLQQLRLLPTDEAHHDGLL